jgi:hypothetical protein
MKNPDRVGSLVLMAGLLALIGPGIRAQGDPLQIIRKAAAAERVVYRLTEPAEIRELLGPPLKETETPSGGMVMLEWEYDSGRVSFGKMRGDAAPFTLRRIIWNGERVDIGEDRKMVLRTEDDLRKVDRFWGLQNISLVRLDLRDRKALLDGLSFDTLTEWPPPECLPPEFHPKRLIDNAADPGLGIRSLHERGIDGSGVGLAVIDQPLLLGHEEYSSRIVRYDATGLGDMDPQMHGAPVASIAVGRSIGVAPRAELTYFAVPTWRRDNLPYVQALDRIMALNTALPEDQKIRAVSISTGMFSQQDHFDEWTSALRRAEARGILVVTCDPSHWHYGILTLTPGEDPDRPESYRPGRYTSPEDVLRVPGAGKTVASHRGAEIYTFDRQGGMSWGAPYIAGLSALGFQVNPGLSPEEIITLLLETAVRTEAGPLVNPVGFIEAAKGRSEKRTG